jgi:hypothetical protein
MSHDYVSNTNMTSDGGAYYGIMGGVESNGALRGNFAAIYIDPSGNAGILWSDLNGSSYIASGMMAMLEQTVSIGEPLAEGLGYLTDDMENYVYSTGGAGMLVGSFGDPESYINANESLTTYAIADLEGGVAEKWGIYLQTLNGDYCDAAEVGSFNAKMGGNDSFGMVTWSDGLPYDEGYWLADVDGTLNGDNTIDAVLEGLFITKSKMGTMSGDIFGYGNAAPGEAGYWNGVGVGAWQGSPLSFFSDFQLYLNNDETSYEAYAGGINSLWSTVVAPTITLIAMADEAWYGGSTPQLWFSGEEAVHSEDYVNDTSMTSDLGAYYGVMGGVESNREIRGVFAALYIDPDGNAGVLWSDLQGGVYPEIGMIGMIDQVITKTPIYEGADLDPSELVIFGTRGTGLISGTFGGMGFINGSDELNAYAIIDQNGSGTLPWGLYTQNIGGSYSNSSTSNLFGAVMGGYDPFGMISVFGTGNTQDNSYWIMNVSGSLNQDYTIDGSVSNGVFLGRTTMGTFLRGDIMGVYYPDSPGATTGYWEGLGVGVWQKSPLSFFSEQSIYYGATESTFNAYIGGVTSLWSSNAANLPSITVIAACNTDGTTQLWSADGAIYSFNYQNGTNTTYDNGAYYGYMGGYASGGSARGMFAALYIDPAGKAGILWSDLSGSLYSSIGMLAMLNNFVENPIFAPGGTGVAASDLLASVSRNESLSQAVLSGAFKTGGSITGNAYFEADSIVDNINKVAQGWGLYTLDVSGTYTGSSITYSTLIGGNNEFGFYYSGPTDSKTINSDSGYWIGNIEGSVNPNNTLDGILSGKFLTHTLLGTLEGAIMGIVHPDSLVPTNGTIEALGLGAWDGDALSYVSDIQTQVKSFAVTATTVRYDASYHIYGNSGNGNNKLTRDVDYYYYSDNSLGYKKDFQYTYNGQGRQSMSNGSYERTYNANGTWTGQYWQGNSWNTNSGTWNGTLSGTIETNLPTPDSNDVFTSSQTGGWALSITNTGNSFITGLAGGVSDIVWGQTSQMTIMGTVSSSFAAGNVWSADIKSHNYINGTDTTYDGGAYMGYLLGAKPGTPDGLFVALYVDPSQKGGYLLGKISGELYPGLGMFEATGDILATKMSDNVGILPVDLTALGSTSSDTMTWQGSGKFAQGGSLVTMASGQTLQINNQDWGIWTAFIGGNYTYPTGGITSQDWSTALSGESASGAHIIGTASGNIWADHKVEGTFNGIYVAPGQTAGSVSIGKVEGLVDGGYIEVDAVSGTWNAASAGEWVEVSDLLDQTKMFGANGIAELNKFVNVPVTEVYRNLLTSTACAGGITSATMNLNLYALDPNVLSGIWTALINGGYSGTVNPTGWSATVSGNGGATNVTVAGTQWANNQWVADVTGTVNVNGSTVNITNGQAGGTYTNPDVNGAGTFTGAGAGTYQAP